MMDNAITVMHFGGRHETPTSRHALYAGSQKPGELGGYYKIIRLLMLAGFCLLCCSTARGQFTVEVLPQVQTFSVVVIQPIAEPVQSVRQWFLVSEPWCPSCPRAKDRFLKLGWPPENVLTISQCRTRFGFRVPHVPYEFGWPVKSPATQKVQLTQDLIRLHDQLHNQASELNTHWTWPGDIRQHLQSVHNVSL